MSRDRQLAIETKDSAAHLVVRRLAWRYLAVLLSVATLVVVDQAIVQPMLIHVNAFAPAINVAGRQRMLSQRLTKAALALREADDDDARRLRLDELTGSLEQWTAEHDALVDGKAELGVQPIRTIALDAEWEKLNPHYKAMVSAAGSIVEGRDNTRLIDETPSPLAELVAHEALFLPTMDRIVKLMEGEAEKAVLRLRASALAIAGLVILLLIGLGWFVVRPATRTIRSQVDELEARVAQRTTELAAALASLEREVREREETELKNHRLAAQLTHTERVTTMGHLTAGLAHELNQPLAAITNYAEACELLLQDVSPTLELGRISELVVKAKRAALRAGQIVRRMRNFVRPNAGAHSPIALNTLAREIVELCRTEIVNARADVHLQLDAEDDVVVADAIQIQQVLVNLIQNALQAMKSADCPVRKIVLHTSNVIGRAQVDVIDSGPGFSFPDPGAAFAPFHTTKQDGLGIGLSICRSIIENHRGRISAESRPGRGAHVSFTLPLAAEHASNRRTQPDCLCC
jgi:two-component system, LuxR family, sensor kinase FixL